MRRAARHLGSALASWFLGQMLARLEIEVLLAALARKVRTIELAGKPDYLLNNTCAASGAFRFAFAREAMPLVKVVYPMASDAGDGSGG